MPRTSSLPELSGAEARRMRMSALLLSDAAERPSSVAGVVEWFGAMQSQDLSSGLWSLGVRLPGSTVADVNSALERREALRTWPMRGTVHLVPARDARWMLDLMGAKPLAGAAKRREFLGLDEAMADRAVDVLGAALAGGGRLTRAECLQTLEDAGITGSANYGYHLLWYASQHGVTCIAPNVDGEQTFVRLDEWVPDPVTMSRDDALATIALRYVRSHGPVPRKDLAGWTGLGAADVRRAVELAGEQVAEVRVDGQDMLVATDALDATADADAAPADGEVWALPGFDEYLLGYKDRSLMASAGHMQAVIPGQNGVFRPTLVRDGQVVATWKRASSRTKLVVDVMPLRRLLRRDRTAAEARLDRYAEFLGLPLTVRWSDHA